MVVDQIAKISESKKSSATYNGYSSCPLYTGDQQLMLMEFKYGGVADETFTNSQDKPNRLFFHFKKNLFPWIYWHIAPKGTWFGKRTLFKPSFE